MLRRSLHSGLLPRGVRGPSVGWQLLPDVLVRRPMDRLRQGQWIVRQQRQCKAAAAADGRRDPPRIAAPEPDRLQCRCGCDREDGQLDADVGARGSRRLLLRCVHEPPRLRPGLRRRRPGATLGRGHRSPVERRPQLPGVPAAVPGPRREQPPAVLGDGRAEPAAPRRGRAARCARDAGVPDAPACIRMGAPCASGGTCCAGLACSPNASGEYQCLPDIG